MADRIFVEHYNGDKERIVMDMDMDDADLGPQVRQVFNIPQAKQLVIDLNKLIAGETPSEDAEVEGVED